jgi:hypothetical protein
MMTFYMLCFNGLHYSNNDNSKTVKYAYQESPHSENTASPRSEKEEREREHVFIRI